MTRFPLRASKLYVLAKMLPIKVALLSVTRVGWRIFKKYKTCAVFLSSYRNTSGSLGEREMLWEDWVYYR